jgi:conjugal transfer pilus assembly protein TraB
MNGPHTPQPSAHPTPGTHPYAPAQMGGLWLHRLSPRQWQYGLLALILASGVLLLWLVFRFSDAAPRVARQPSAQPGDVTNIGVMPPGGQVSPLDQWVGQAGRKLAQYESEREEQGRQNKDRQAFEARTMQRFAELEQRLVNGQPIPPPPSAIVVPPQATTAPAVSPPGMPPLAALPPRPVSAPPAPSVMPQGPPPLLVAPTPPPAIVRLSLVDRTAPPTRADETSRSSAEGGRSKAGASTVATYLPVSFTRGILLGGLDAPTGGQSQANPHPVLIRLADNSMLPNQFRGAYRECFVVAAGYGDISSERAYLRTESLSCVRADGHTLEVRIQGTVYGEDGKVGMRGRLVTKQGQMLANALLAGVVSGIGQGLSTANTSYSNSPLGTIASTDSNADAYRAGLGSGVGKALDRLAQYYIKLAENTFPVIEVDAGRQIDVVITKGVRIDVPMTAMAEAGANRDDTPDNRYQEPTDDQNY